MYYFIRFFLAIALALTTFGSLAAVSEQPQIPGFSFRVESGFAITASTTGGPAYWFNPQGSEVPKQLAPGITGADPSPEPAFHGAPSTLSWGNGSSLSVGGETGGHFQGFMPLDGTMVETVPIRFTNRENDDTKPALTYGLLADGAWLQTGAGELHTPLFWEIFYLDTPESPGCQTPGCADITIVKPMGMTYSEKLGMFTATRELFGREMTSLLKIEGLSVLDDNVCGLFGSQVGSGCVGMFVPENAVTSLQVKVGSIPGSVPLPPSVWMLGSAMGFLSIFFRNKKTTVAS